jgi:MFS superfamily sulfate permease-like transporter
MTVPPEAVDPTLAYVDFLIGVGIGILISVSFILWSDWRR